MPTNPSWRPNLNATLGLVIIDPNGNVQQCMRPGLTGLQTPAFALLNLGAQTQDGAQVQWVLIAILAPPVLPAFPLPALPTPTFVNDAEGLDPNLILNAQITVFEAETGRILYPAQPERLYINGSSYRETLVRQQMQEVGEQSLVAFARYPQLDYLGALVGVTRLGAQPAVTTIQFTLANALSVPFKIGAGTQVGTADGQFQFSTDADLTISAGETIGSVTATLVITSGVNPVNANGYLPGAVNVLLNPNSLIASVANLSTTADGTIPEADDHLRARIQQAPNLFTCAGPAAEYQALALGVSPAIIDAFVPEIPATPGVVDAWILTGPTGQPASSPNSGAIASGPLIAQVQAALSALTVRPLCDTVNVHAVTEVDYTIAATITPYSDADIPTLTSAANAAAIEFAENLAARIGRDIVLSEIIAALSVPGVYSVVLSSPSASVPLTAGQWANCTAITLTIAAPSTEHS